MDEQYIPVSCEFYDQLEAFSTLGTPCEIGFLQEESKAVLPTCL